MYYYYYLFLRKTLNQPTRFPLHTALILWVLKPGKTLKARKDLEITFHQHLMVHSFCDTPGQQCYRMEKNTIQKLIWGDHEQ